jgi:hypothetical protein
MSDAPSGFNSPHVQIEQQRRHYENTTHLRRGHRSQLKPVGAVFAGNVPTVLALSQQIVLSVTPKWRRYAVPTLPPSRGAECSKPPIMSTTSQGPQTYESAPIETDAQPASHSEPTNRAVIATLAGGAQ